MMRAISLVAVCSGCSLLSGGDDAPVDPPRDAGPDLGACVSPSFRDNKVITVSGTVVDFATGAPVEGATVDITTAWDVGGSFPLPECPLLATLHTGPSGAFGPVTVQAGSPINPSFVIFMVHGGDRAQTASDNRSCNEAACTLEHQIAAVSSATAAAWRGELAAGGMPDADTRGLVAFTFRNPDGSIAAGVEATRNSAAPSPFVRGREVRYLAADRVALLPVGELGTSAAGVALVGANGSEGSLFIGGRRPPTQWSGTGCLVEPGWVFLEDKTGREATTQ